MVVRFLGGYDSCRAARPPKGAIRCLRFGTARWYRCSRAFTLNELWQQDAYRMIQRRAKAAGVKTRIGNHSFRATGITAYLKNNGTLEHAQTLANHASPRTTKLYDRRSDEISLRCRSRGRCGCR